MKKILFFTFVASCTLARSFSQPHPQSEATKFPAELVQFIPYAHNPVFAGTGHSAWDAQIRERGYILKEGKEWHLWYTGYRDIHDTKYLGYAHSTDGISWTRESRNPVYHSGWVEDMCVVKSGDTYYMFAEGRGDTAHLLTSTDRINWEEKGKTSISGSPMAKKLTRVLMERRPSGKRRNAGTCFMNGTIQLFGWPAQWT